jgi:hypothetical protein
MEFLEAVLIPLMGILRKVYAAVQKLADKVMRNAQVTGVACQIFLLG